jgi:predicted nucleic acid-binding protein
VIAYLDTSSLVKLYVEERGSRDVRQVIADADVVATASIAYAELRATLARLRREAGLSPSAHAALRRQVDMDWPALFVLRLTDSLSRTAGDLADRFELRGFDAIHLASFVEVLARAGDEDVQFSSFDDRLNRAARKLA